jgi:hypothetical protein
MSLSFLFLAAFSLTPVEVANPFVATPPTVNISSVRRIVCDHLSGSGFLIADKVLATAHHVAVDTNCIDVETKTPLTMYQADKEHDFALMTGIALPTDMPYIKYGCSKFITKMPYISYGITDAKGAIGFYPRPLIRANILYATDGYTQQGFHVGKDHQPGMRIMEQPIEFGMSGGPVVNLDGVALAVNNAGTDTNTILYELADTILCKS